MNRMRQTVARAWTNASASRLTMLAALALLALVAQPRAASGQQWTSDGNGNITTTGNVGVGTSTPGGRLSVAGGSAAGGSVEAHVVNSTSTGYSSLRVGVDAVAASGGAIHFFNPGWATYGADIADGAELLSFGGGGLSLAARHSSGAINFFTGGGGPANRRMTILPGGNVGIGTTSPQSLLHLGSSNGAALTLDTPSAVKGRIETIPGVNNWFANTLNADYNGGWHLDSPSTDGWFFKLDARDAAGTASANNGVWLFRVPAGAGAHTDEYAVFGATVDKAAVGRLGVSYSPTSALDVKSAGSTSATSGLSVINSSNVTNLFVRDDGNVGVGTTAPSAKLDVQGSINVSGNINAKYQDVAEWVRSAQALPAGTVVVLDPSRPDQVLASETPYDTKVAGVVSARPGIALGEGGAGKLLVATTGRVRIKADATRASIRIGDLLVTGDAPGVAMRSEPVMISGRPFHAPGTIIGKALEPLEKGTGEILVLLSLQ